MQKRFTGMTHPLGPLHDMIIAFRGTPGIRWEKQGHACDTIMLSCGNIRRKTTLLSKNMVDAGFTLLKGEPFLLNNRLMNWSWDGTQRAYKIVEPSPILTYPSTNLNHLPSTYDGVKVVDIPNLKRNHARVANSECAR